MDFITDLPPSRNNKAVYDTILVIVDSFSKMSLYILAKKTWRAEESSGRTRPWDWDRTGRVTIQPPVGVDLEDYIISQ
jgi:hypothetical protein